MKPVQPLSPHLQQIIEKLCGNGCRRVRDIIREIETGQKQKEMADLTADETRLVLTELKSIMDVYDKCRS